MTTRLTRLTTGLIGATLTLALLIGPPWLLTTYVGPPMPTSWPDLDALTAIVTTGVTDTFVITTLAVVVWIAWAQLAIAIVIETLAAIRRRPALRLPVLPGTQPFASQLVAATLLLVTVLQPRPIAAASLEVPAMAVAAADSPAPATGSAMPAMSAMPERPAAPPDTVTVTAGERDSWWSLAETHLGDGIRWRELRDLNLDRRLSDGRIVRTDTDRLEPGWDLLVPTQAGDAVTGDRNAPDTGDDPDTSDHADSAVWDVVEGEHFWGAAAHTLEQSWGRSPTDDEVVPYWQQLIEANGERLAPPHNPDLIHPGQQFVLPDPPEDPTDTTQPPDNSTTETDSTQEADEAAPPEDTPAPVAPEPTSPPPAPADPTDTIDPSETAEPTETSGSGEPVAPAGPPEASGSADVDGAFPDHLDLPGTPSHPAPDHDEPPEDTRTGDTALQIPAGLRSPAAAAALAAAGIVALLSRRRRTALQQRTPTFRLPTPAPEFLEHLGTLTAAAPPETVLNDLVDLLSTIPDKLSPTLVLIHDSGPISLVFEQPPTETPPPPWELDDDEGGPPRWTAQLGTRGPRRSIGLPLLLTLGRTETTTVLVNLGAIPTLAVTGPSDAVTDRLRAAALELACSRTAGPLEVTVIGPKVPAIEQLDAADDPTTAIAAAVDEAEQGIIADDRLPRIIICHDPDRHVELPATTTGYLALLTAATDATASWHLELDDTRTWLHTPDGDRHELTSPDIHPRLIADELDRLQPANATPEPPGTASNPPPSTDATTGTHSDTTCDPEPDPTLQPAPQPEVEAWCEVGLLGPLQVTCGGHPLESLTPTVRQLLPYLATHRQGVTLDRLDDAIWPGRNPSRHNQRARTALTRLRRALGDGPDGQPLINRRAHGEQPVTVSRHVTTDVDRALRHLEIAKTCHDDDRLGQLQVALELIRGEPFQDLPYSWTLDVQQHAITHLHDAALEAARLLRQAGRYDEADHAIRQGLALYDPSEPLYVEWAHLEHARGRPDRIEHLRRRLHQRYADQADETAGTITTPTIETELTFTTLTQGRQP